MNTRRSALVAAHGAAALFGLTGIFGALIHADAGVITFGRAGFAVAALALFALVTRRALLAGLDRYKLRLLLLTGLLLAAHWVTFFIAVKAGGVAVATLGFASFPALIALLDMLVFRERIGAPEAILLALVTLGLALVTPSFDIGDKGTAGLLWGVLSGLSFALLAMANRRGGRGMEAMQVAFWQNLVVCCVLAPFVLAPSYVPVSAPVFAPAFAPVSATASATISATISAHSGLLPFAAGALGALQGMDWLYLALLGVFCTGLAQYLFVKSLEGLNARSAGMIIALEPVYAIACAWWLFAQQPSLRMLAGAALIIVAIMLSARSDKTPPAAPPSPDSKVPA